jgi:steroid 5-alpha reductase family enzyme
MTTGVVIARYGKQKKWWLKAHRILGILGTFQVWAGFFAATIMVSRHGGEHFDVPHAWLGLGIALLALAAPLAGQMQLTLRNKAPRLRIVHHWTGRLTLAFLLINMTIGLFLAR